MKFLLALCIPVAVLLGGCAGGAPYDSGSDLYFGASNDSRLPVWMNRDVGMPATRIR